MSEPCINCGRNTTTKRCGGRCEACHRFLQRHGRDSLPEERRRSTKVLAFCRCGNQIVKGSSTECATCHNYRRRTGRGRPRHLYGGRTGNRAPCKICNKPYAIGFCKGRCPTCNTYLYKNGRDRDERLIRKIAPLGYCECGSLAVTTLEVAVDTGSTVLQLCKDCYEFEEQYR